MEGDHCLNFPYNYKKKLSDKFVYVENVLFYKQMPLSQNRPKKNRIFFYVSLRNFP